AGEEDFYFQHVCSTFSVRSFRHPLRGCRATFLWTSKENELAARRAAKASQRGHEMPSSDGTFQTDIQQFLRLDGKLHRQLPEPLLADAVDNQRHRILLADAARAAVE